MARVSNKIAAAAAYFSSNRARLELGLGQDYLVLVNSGQAPHRTADENYPFWADRNYFYLAGLEQEECILLLFAHNGQKQQVLFIDQQDPMYERWQGHRADLTEARAVSGLADVRLKDEFSDFIAALPAPARVFLDLARTDASSEQLKAQLTQLLPDQLADCQDLAPLLTSLRMIKQDYELERMQAAIELTGQGIRAMLDRLEPGLMEYQLWAAFAGALAEKGCLSPAFPTIVASGKNIFCLHYMTPYDQIQAGELVQIDLGAIVDGLCADISRVFPASGRFSPQQKMIYQLVRQCQETAFATIKPGASLADINSACRQTAAAGLIKAGLLEKEADVTDYFWHSVSHHLGLDVHDLSDRNAKLAPGMVLTVEPGLYLPELNIGMRLEDDVLVTETGCVNLSQAIPREADEIEELLAQRRM